MVGGVSRRSSGPRISSAVRCRNGSRSAGRVFPAAISPAPISSLARPNRPIGSPPTPVRSPDRTDSSQITGAGREDALGQLGCCCVVRRVWRPPPPLGFGRYRRVRGIQHAAQQNARAHARSALYRDRAGWSCSSARQLPWHIVRIVAAAYFGQAVLNEGTPQLLCSSPLDG